MSNIVHFVEFSKPNRYEMYITKKKRGYEMYINKKKSDMKYTLGLHKNKN